MSINSLLNTWEKIGPSEFLLSPDLLVLNQDSSSPMTKTGFNKKILFCLSLSLIFLITFSYLLFKNTQGNFIKNGLGWFTLIPLPLIYFLTFRQWKNVANLKYVASILPILWGAWLGSLVGVFEHSFAGVALQALTVLCGVLLAVYFSFQFLGFKGNIALRFVIAMGIILMNITLIDFTFNMLFLEYTSMFFNSLGAPSIFLIVYMVILGAASISVELSLLEKAIEDNYQKESEWYFAYKIVSICFFLAFWILLLVMQSRSKK